MTLPYIMSSDAITVMVRGSTVTVQADQPHFGAVRDAIKNKDWDRLPDLLTPLKAIETFGQGRVAVVNGEVLLDGEVIHNAVTQRILALLGDGFTIDPLCRFLERVMANPSRTAVQELYLWLEGTRLPITEDGCFMAYKKVRDDYLDFHTGTVLNKPADLMTDADLQYISKPQNGVTVSVVNGVTVVSMPRNRVDDRRENLCSQGLHFCSLSYLPSYNGGRGRILLVKIDPADVVSIPSDYDNAKGRTSCYEILGEHTQGEREEAYTSSVAGSDGSQRASPRASAGADEAFTWVMGVNFGIQTRADQVLALIDRAANQSGPDLSEAQGRLDGFDDAWENKSPTLDRYTGGHIREAVSYARAYFEGYDRCRGHSPQVQADVSEPSTAADDFDWEGADQRDEILRVMALPLEHKAANNTETYGSSDGASDAEADIEDGNDYDLSHSVTGNEAYRRGYIARYTEVYNESNDHIYI
jgi:hypothetical protein